MNETTKAFSDAFIKYVEAKRKLIKENVPHYIKVKHNHLNDFINQMRNEQGIINFSFSSDGEYYIEKDFLNETYEVPLVMDDKIETYEEVYQD